jgi:hypothetical protein
MVTLGSQTARVLKNYVAVDDKGQIYVNLKFSLADESSPPMWSRIYITEKSAGIARAKLKKCGFDMDAQTLTDIEDNDELLAGNEVAVNVVENGKYFNLEIPTDRPKVAKSALQRATEQLRAAKKNRDEDEDFADPSEMSETEKARLNAKAEEQGLPF